MPDTAPSRLSESRIRGNHGRWVRSGPPGPAPYRPSRKARRLLGAFDSPWIAGGMATPSGTIPQVRTTASRGEIDPLVAVAAHLASAWNRGTIVPVGRGRRASG